MGSNSFADAARAKKVAALVRYFDRRFTVLGRHPYTEAEWIAETLRESVTEKEWKRHAVLAGVNKPSADSVAMVIREYEERASVPVTEPVRMYGGVN